jgi:hypothetical protein
MVLTVGEAYNLAAADSAVAVPQAAGLPVSSNLPLYVCLLRPVLAQIDSSVPVANAYDTLAAALASAGHHVQIIYLPGQYCPVQNIRFWSEHYRNMGIDFVPLPEMPEIHIEPSGPAQNSYRLLQYLLRRQDRLNIVHIPVWPGVGYHSMLAKHQGWAMRRTHFVVGLDPPTTQTGRGQPPFLHQVEEMEAAFMQRQMIEMADALWSTQPHSAATLLGEHFAPGIQEIQPACDPLSGVSHWLRWHDALLAKPKQRASNPLPKNHAAPTLVSVCVSHYNRPILLARALDSIRQQDYPHVEVVVCDDGSTDPAAIRFLSRNAK